MFGLAIDWAGLDKRLAVYRWWLGVIVLAIVLLVIWGLVHGLDRARTAAATADAAGKISAGQTAAAKDAIGIQDQALNAATQSTDLTRETADAIEHAPGANAPIDPDLNRLGRQRLCQRAAYSHRPECLQHPGGANAAR